MRIRTPQAYSNHKSRFVSLQRDHLGNQYTWPRITRHIEPEELPLTTRTYDFYFLRGLPLAEQDEAIMCYAITTWMQLADKLRAAAQPYMLYIVLFEADRATTKTLWPRIDYVPNPGQYFSPRGLRPPVSKFGQYVTGVCAGLVDPSDMILLEADDSEQPPNVQLTLDFRTDGGAKRVRLDDAFKGGPAESAGGGSRRRVG